MTIDNALQAVDDLLLSTMASSVPLLRETSLDLARTAYQAGRTTLLNVLEAERALLTARGGYVDALQASASMLVELEKVTGQPLARILEAVQTSVNPKVIDCPDPQKSHKAALSAIAKNGVELRVRARVTVRTNLKRLIGGATEETIIARVGEGIITSIGSSETHLEVMENPDHISKAVLERGLDAQTAFEIVSIDIADIDVGENIGARLRADQAEADTRVARARAEGRAASARAREQEMKAEVAGNRARVILAEAEVPMAMAGAFRQGNLEAPSRRDGGPRPQA